MNDSELSLLIIIVHPRVNCARIINKKVKDFLYSRELIFLDYKKYIHLINECIFIDIVTKPPFKLGNWMKIFKII